MYNNDTNNNDNNNSNSDDNDNNRNIYMHIYVCRCIYLTINIWISWGQSGIFQTNLNHMAVFESGVYSQHGLVEATSRSGIVPGYVCTRVLPKSGGLTVDQEKWG